MLGAQFRSGAETVARLLFEEVRIADRVVVEHGTILFEDQALAPAASGGAGVQRFQLQQIEGILSRPWRSENASLALAQDPQLLKAQSLGDPPTIIENNRAFMSAMRHNWD